VAVIVKARQPYLEWARRDDAEGLAESVFETLHEEPTVYLLPECETPSSQHEVLAEPRQKELLPEVLSGG